MISVEDAEKIIQAQTIDYGTEIISFETSVGRVLAEDLLADRDFPPFNRAVMDGIAIQFSAFEKGLKRFIIKGTQPAGSAPLALSNENECVEIMTGAALFSSADTVIRYEDIEIKDGVATILQSITKAQNIHKKGSDKKQNDVLVTAGTIITPEIISIAASTGKTELTVKKNPRIVIISSGDELIEVQQTPDIYQIRRSNSYAIKAVLEQYKLAAGILHIPDNKTLITDQLKVCLENYDILILSGGVSMGKFDFIPQALKDLQAEQLFHKVKQKPGKPFWFGKFENKLIFAFPGNPVSAFMCLHRYFIPWFATSMQQTVRKIFAILTDDFEFKPALQYFLQVKTAINNKGEILATPVTGNGSGDFANLSEANAFMEFPAERNNFAKGEAYRIWPFKSIY